MELKNSKIRDKTTKENLFANYAKLIEVCKGLSKKWVDEKVLWHFIVKLIGS